MLCCWVAAVQLMVGPAKTLFMDEISTGLDSSTTYLIVRCIRNYVHLLDVSLAPLLPT
jgi:ABC-type multidrug transport system ATPase subunit